MRKYWIISIIIFVIFAIMDCCIVIFPILFLTNKGSLGDYYSGGQLFFDIMLIPIAIIGFYISYNEFKKRQDKAKLRLYWENGVFNDDQTISIKCHKVSDGRHYLESTLPIVLINNGDIIPSQYSIILESDSRLSVRPNIGEPIDSEHWKRDVTPKKHILIFYSHDKFPAYPNTPQKIVSIVDNSQRFNFTYIENTRITYTIYSDKSNKVTGTLKIEINDY